MTRTHHHAQTCHNEQEHVVTQRLITVNKDISLHTDLLQWTRTHRHTQAYYSEQRHFIVRLTTVKCRHVIRRPTPRLTLRQSRVAILSTCWTCALTRSAALPSPVTQPVCCITQSCNMCLEKVCCITQSCNTTLSAVPPSPVTQQHNHICCNTVTRPCLLYHPVL